MFEVDRKGLAKLLDGRGKRFVLLELIQNALDERGVSRVLVTLEPGRARTYRVEVEDDAPAGFADLTHAYTLFAESRKKANPEQRGRWNLGDKLVIAVCDWAQIRTTTGTVTFSKGERLRSNKKRPAGSVFEGVLGMTHAEAGEAIRAARSVLVPNGVQLVVNGEVVRPRVQVTGGQVTLPTDVADGEGVLRRRERSTWLSIHEPLDGELPHVYELGIPVVESGLPWHVNVGQKVPLSFDRDNVPPAFRRALGVAVANMMAHYLDAERASQPWAIEALGDRRAEPETVRSIVSARHGELAVAYDPSDAEGSKIAVTRGYQVVHGGTYGADQWERIRAAGALLPAGKVTPSPKPFSPDGAPLRMLQDENRRHVLLADYALRFAHEVVGIVCRVRLADDPNWGFGACYGAGVLTVNCAGRSWFESPESLDAAQEEVDALLIHEYAHVQVDDHLSSAFHEECCRLGAALAAVARRDVFGKAPRLGRLVTF